jgi:hypothetical protein
MKVYKADSLYVLGVDGGSFEGMTQEPQAIIGDQRPVPTKMWQTPTEVRENHFEEESWEYDFTFREFQLEEKKIHILQVVYKRYKPGYLGGNCEFIVSEEFVKEKIESLRQRNSLAEYEWDANRGKWNVVEKLFRDEFDLEDEDEDDEEEHPIQAKYELESTVDKYRAFFTEESSPQEEVDYNDEDR